MKDLRSFSYPIVAPSILAADKSALLEEIKKAERFGAKYLHIDIMDGIFVPATSFSLDVLQKIHDQHHLLNDVHIMIADPLHDAEKYALAGADNVTFHYEACQKKEDVHETIRRIHQAGARAGLSIKPATPVSVLKDFLEEVDLILLMSVEPGKGGQKFIPESLNRLDEITALLAPLPNRPVIEIDGGINQETAKLSLAHGAEALVAGSYLFGHPDMEERLKEMLR